MGAETTNDTSDTFEVKREDLGLPPKTDQNEDGSNTSEFPKVAAGLESGTDASADH